MEGAEKTVEMKKVKREEVAEVEEAKKMKLPEK